jgi:hypothetical protein
MILGESRSWVAYVLLVPMGDRYGLPPAHPRMRRMRKNLALGARFLVLIQMRSLELVVSATSESKSKKRANADSHSLDQTHAAPPSKHLREGWMPSQP